MHFLSIFLVLGPYEDQKRGKNEAEGGSKCKIFNNDPNNVVEVLQLDQYVIQVGR